MSDGRAYQVREQYIHLKLFEEPEHVLFLLQVKNTQTKDDVKVIKGIVEKQKKFYKRPDRSYVPKYRRFDGKIVEMKTNTARIVKLIGVDGLEFNPDAEKACAIILDEYSLRKSKINDLRYAIYQIDPINAKLVEIRRRLQNELDRTERGLLNDYLRTTPDVEEIRT